MRASIQTLSTIDQPRRLASAYDQLTAVISIIPAGPNGGPSTTVRTAVGAASSVYVPRSAITQDHAVTAREGSSAQSASASFTSGGVGEYLPGAFARHTTAGAGFRVVRSRLIATGTGRLFASESADPTSPLFRDSVSAARSGLVIPQSVRELTVGVSANFIQSEHWAHAIVAGFDGSRLSNLADYHTPLPSASGPDLGTAGGNANLATLRLSSIAKIGSPENLETTLSFAAENSLLDFRSQPETTSTQTTAGSAAGRFSTTQSQNAFQVAGWKRGGLLDGFVPPLFVVTSALPYFWVALVMILLFASGPHALFPNDNAFDNGLQPGFNAPGYNARIKSVCKDSVPPTTNRVNCSRENSGGKRNQTNTHDIQNHSRLCSRIRHCCDEQLCR